MKNTAIVALLVIFSMFIVFVSCKSLHKKHEPTVEQKNAEADTNTNVSTFTDFKPDSTKRLNPNDAILKVKAISPAQRADNKFFFEVVITGIQRAGFGFHAPIKPGDTIQVFTSEPVEIPLKNEFTIQVKALEQPGGYRFFLKQ